MAMPLDYSRSSLAQPFGEVTPIIDATSTPGAIGQIINFMLRHQGYRVGVPDTSFFPFSAICRLNLTFPSGLYHGTGFYIGPGLILTCGHNLFDKAPGGGTEACTSIQVRVGQQNSATALDTFTLSASDFTAHPTWVASAATDRGFDLGILRVRNPPPRTEYFELINYSPSPETPIAVCGYGAEDVDGERQHLDIDRIRAVTNGGENVDYNLQTRRGNSGSPVFAHFTNEAGGDLPQTIPVMGVHVASESNTLNRGVLLTPDKIEWALGGGISSVSAFSLSRGPGRSLAALGGLPLMRADRASLGGLPLGPQAHRPMTRTQSWARPLDRSWIVIDQGASGGMSVAKRTFGHPTNDLSGKTTLSVRVPNMPSGGSIRWNIPDSVHKTRITFEAGGSTSESTSGTSATLRSLAGGPVAVDCMVKDASGTTLESNKYWLSSPQFVIVAIHPTTDAFFDSIGMRARKATIYAEMKATMRHLYRNVNIRLIFPGDTLPIHLGLASDPAFPAGVRAQPSVYYSETIGSETIMDPEASMRAGTPTPYRPTLLGRNHEPGDQPAPLDRHSVARSLIHRFGQLFGEIAPIEAAATAGTLSAGDMDLAARMYGRLMGENAAHEVGHYMANAFVPHDTAHGGLTDEGNNRSFTDRTGMTVNGSGPILSDAGRNTVNDLSVETLRTFEEFLPIDPPIDQARVNVRGRVGSFSMSRQGGWVTRSVGRSLSDETTVHLPGASVLSGWQAEAFVFAIETAFRTALAGNPALMALSYFVSVDTILDACDRFGVTLALGLSGSGGLGTGGGVGAGIVFAPGNRIGFYGSLNGIVGHIYSVGASIQLTLINGGPELMDGTGYMVGVSVGTIGWFDAGTLDVPIAAHRVYDGGRNPIGYSFEVGVSAGLPVVSLIEAFGQASQTATSFAVRRRSYGHGLSAQTATGYEDAVQQAMASGATREQAEAFLAPLFG